MRPRTAYVVWAAALTLGGLAGLVLPGPSATGPRSTTAPVPSSAARSPRPAASSASTPSSGTPPASPTSPSGTGAPAGLTTAALVTADDFARVVVDVSVDLGRTPRRDAGVTACTEQNPSGSRTFRDLTGHDPGLLALYRQDGTGDTAGEVAASTGSAAEATVAARRLVDVLSACERSGPGEAVYSPPTRLDLPEGRSASWFGAYVDERKVDGRAPAGEEPCGGVVVATNGERVAVLDVAICVSSTQLGSLADLTARRLR